MNDALIRAVDIGTPGPTRLAHMLQVLASVGIPTACRIQPVLPTLEHHAEEVIASCSELGVRHVATEHLKLGVERGWRGAMTLGRALKIDLHEYFRRRDARRVGREWVLGLEQRLRDTLRFRDLAHKGGMTYGAADNELLLLSDGTCCCSGVDTVAGFDRFFRYNYVEAVRRGLNSKYVSFSNLAQVWAPKGSIAQYVNSRSRLKSNSSQGYGIKNYIAANWNGSLHGNGPSSLFGLQDSGELDERGFKLYEIGAKLKELLQR